MMNNDGYLADDLVEKIVAFVDREAGRDAPLHADDEAMIRRLIDEDPAVRQWVDGLRATNAGLDSLLDDVAAVEVPDELVTLIRSHGTDGVTVMPSPAGDITGSADLQASAGGGVVAMPQVAPRRRSYGPLAAAASIALMISSGALYYIYNDALAERTRLQAAVASATEEAETRGRALADAETELQRLTGLAEQASSLRLESTDQLLANEDAIQQLRVEQAALEGRYDALEADNQRLNELLEQRRTQVADSDADRDRLVEDLTKARRTLADAETQSATTRATLNADVQNLNARLEQREQELAILKSELEASEGRSTVASADLAQVREEQAELERRLATAELDKQQLAAAANEAEAAVNEATAEAAQQLATLEAELANSTGRLATVVAGLTAAEEGRQEALQSVVGLQADLATSRSWLGQIAQYHRVYASTSRRHLVEVGADELDHIQTWLTNMIGREIIVPDLTDFDVTFAGARLLAINDRPVAQLIYLDADDQPLAFCITSQTGGAKDPTLSVNRNLNLVDWRDGRHGYAVVGWSDPTLLNTLTSAIQPLYDL